ncbi:hypothetical protein pb186bvf_001784 [Paramecium bursaria]
MKMPELADNLWARIVLEISITKTRRQMERLNINSTQIVDPLWEDWIRGVQKKPYSEEELNEIYQTEIQQQKIIHDYEKRDSEMMKKYREEQKQKSREKDYKADQWNPFKK